MIFFFGSPSFHVGPRHCRVARLLLLQLSPSVSRYLFSFSAFSSSTTLCFFSLSFPLLFPVFPLIHQLLTAIPSLSLGISICSLYLYLLLVSDFFPSSRPSVRLFSVFLTPSL